jgi:hypothetical protein
MSNNNLRVLNMSGLNPILTCRELVDLLADDLDQSISGSRYVKFQLHLLLCGSCRRFRRTYRKSVGLLRGLRSAEDRFDLSALSPEIVRRILLRRHEGTASGSGGGSGTFEANNDPARDF